MRGWGHEDVDKLFTGSKGASGSVLEDYRGARAAAVPWVSHDPEQWVRVGGRRLVIRDGRLEPET